MCYAVCAVLFYDRISHQFSFFIIFLPHSDVIMTLVKVESHPPLRAAFASFLPLHHTRRQASSFFLPLPHLFPFHNEKRRFPSHHGTDAFRIYTLITHYADIKRRKGHRKQNSLPDLNPKPFPYVGACGFVLLQSSPRLPSQFRRSIAAYSRFLDALLPEWRIEQHQHREDLQSAKQHVHRHHDFGKIAERGKIARRACHP